MPAAAQCSAHALRTRDQQQARRIFRLLRRCWAWGKKEEVNDEEKKTDPTKAELCCGGRWGVGGYA